MNIRPKLFTHMHYGCKTSETFGCNNKAKFKYTRIEQSSRMGEIDERVRLFPLAIVFFNSFVELKYGKRMIPVKLHELTTREASDVITRFKSHARGRRT